MEHYDAFAGGGEIHDRLAILRRIEEFSVHTDHGDIGLADFVRRLIAILGVVHAEAGRFQYGNVGLAKELSEIVRAAAADEQHLFLSRLPDDGLGLGQGSVAAAPFLRASRPRWRGGI